jgi:glycosyltransferase involved in cell wall biosynthesis
MRIGINARRLAGQRLGVARYIEYMLKYWDGMLDPTERVVVFSREPLAGPPLSSAFEMRVLPSRLDGVAWETAVLGRHDGEVDVLFAPGYTAPMRYGKPSVVAIHSMNEVMPGTHPWWHKQTYSRIYRRSAQQAAKVIVPSLSTQEDIQSYYKIAADKLVVIPLAVDGVFRPADDPDAIHATRVRLVGDDRPYIVFVGKLSQRRNIPTLIEAFARARRQADLPHRLLLFGPNHLHLPLDDLIERSGVVGDVVQTDGQVASHEELAAVYQAADLFVSASGYEGSSLTLIEAMSAGTPVVSTLRGALREVAEGAALTVSDPDPEALADAIVEALTDEATHRRLRQAGLERARPFTWERTAGETLEILRSVGTATS